MRIDREGLLLEPAIEHDIGGLATHTGQPHQIFARVRHFTAIIVNQQLAECDHVLCLGIEQPDGLDVLDQSVEPEVEHLLRRFHLLKQRARCLVHPDIGGLRG